MLEVAASLVLVAVVAFVACIAAVGVLALKLVVWLLVLPFRLLGVLLFIPLFVLNNGGAPLRAAPLARRGAG